MAKGRPAIRPQPEMGAHLARLRLGAGLTQKQLAEKLGVPVSNITFWERGNKPPRAGILPKIARTLGVSVDELLRLEPVKQRKIKVAGRLRRALEMASTLSRSQQDKIAEFVEAFVNGKRQ